MVNCFPQLGQLEQCVQRQFDGASELSEKSGNFYNTYGDDTVIFHHLLGYKYDPHKKSAGFPVVALAKVKVALESKKLVYKIYEKDQVIEETKGIIKEYKASIKEGLKKLDMEERLKNLNDKLDNLSLEDLEKG